MTLDTLNITTPYKVRKFIHLLDSEYSFWRNYQVTGTFMIIYYYYWCCFKNALQIPIWNKNAFYKIPSTCTKCTFLFTWRVKYMNFMNLTGTSLSQFFPIFATSHFVFSKAGHIPIPGRGWVLTYKSVQVFGQGLWSPNPVSNKCLDLVFRPVCVPWHYWTSYGARFDQFMTIKTLSK